MTRTRRYVIRDRSYFSYMNAVWSCHENTRRILFLKAERDEAFDLSDYKDIRQVKRAPVGARAEALVGRRNLAPQN